MVEDSSLVGERLAGEVLTGVRFTMPDLTGLLALALTLGIVGSLAISITIELSLIALELSENDNGMKLFR